MDHGDFRPAGIITPHLEHRVAEARRVDRRLIGRAPQVEPLDQVGQVLRQPVVLRVAHARRLADQQVGPQRRQTLRPGQAHLHAHLHQRIAAEETLPHLTENELMPAVEQRVVVGITFQPGAFQRVLRRPRSARLQKTVIGIHIPSPLRSPGACTRGRETFPRAVSPLCCTAAQPSRRRRNRPARRDTGYSADPASTSTPRSP